jgi:hypothetical protein
MFHHIADHQKGRTIAGLCHERGQAVEAADDGG